MVNPTVKSFAQSFAQAAEKRKVQAMANALAQSRRNSLVVRMPEVENVADDKVYTVIDISLKVWDVLNGLLEIAATVKAAAGAWSAATVSAEAIAASEAAAQAAATVGVSSKVTAAFTVGEAVALAGPLVAYIALWVGLGAPYLEAKQKIAQDQVRRGVAHGVLVGAFGHSPERAKGFKLRQNMAVNNIWVPGAHVVAQNSYGMAFDAGYKQGRDMTQGQRRVFWKVFANTLRKERARLWKNDWRDDKVWDDWFWEAGTVFQKHHLKS
jgi:hypothetical protein